MLKKLDILTYVILLVIFAAIFAAKVWNSYQNSYAPLYIYGILVTSVVITTFFFALRKYRDPALAGAGLPDSEKPFVSCMVAVKDEEKLIDQCIKSFLNQTYKHREIIIVNDASTDRTKEILERYSRQGLINAIHLDKNVGKKRALAQALLRAKGEIFVFSDSDSVLMADSIAKVIDAFHSDPLIGAVAGHCRALNGDKNLLTKVQDSWYEGQFSIKKAFESVFGAVTCVSGPLAAFRKEAIYNFIPAWEADTFLGQEFRFATDRTLTGFVLGSESLADRVKRKYSDSPFVTGVDYPARHWKVVYCKSAKALTAVPDSFRKLIKQQIRWKKSFIRNMFFTGRFYWKKPLIPALVYYLRLLFVIVGPVVAIRHLIYLPIMGDIFSLFLYLGGILLVGMMFGLAYRLENRKCHKWLCRPLMSLMSTLVFSWLIFYSAATIKKMVWARG